MSQAVATNRTLARHPGTAACLIQELLVEVAAAQQEVALDRLKLAQQVAAVLHQVPQQRRHLRGPGGRQVCKF